MIALVRYLAVGVANTLTTLTIVFVLVWSGLEALQANAVGYGVGIALSYTLNRTWTFQDRGPALRLLPRFLMVLAIAYAGNFAMVAAARYVVGLNDYISQLFGIPVYVVIGFVGSRYFVFRNSPS